MILAPTNGTTEELYPSKPKDRKHWGFESERAGVREWAEENGLSVIGEFFFFFFSVSVVVVWSVLLSVGLHMLSKRLACITLSRP